MRASESNFSTGMAWLDPDSGEGCWFTTEIGSIFEDSQKRAWFVAGDRLYSLSIDD
jgi:hypothetical protein